MAPIHVTKPHLPPLAEYVSYLEGIWERGHLTNQGPLVQELEDRLKSVLRVDQPVCCVANGGLALQLALKALGVGGEVITTPFTYVATTSCLLWEGLSPVFADIDSARLTLDPAAVEASVTPRTEAIVATHVYGTPCDVEALESIARRHGLALVYDAAHAFGVEYNERSILEFGDASIVSMHATKLFHCVEGGFVVSRDPGVQERVEWMRRFGHKGVDDFHGIGINAKLSELHAAMGLANFAYLDEIRDVRRRTTVMYDAVLEPHKSIVHSLLIPDGLQRNYAYYPVLFRDERILLDFLQALEASSIFPRRYFWPSLTKLTSNGVSGSCPVAEDVACRVLCLPLSSQMEPAQIQRLEAELHRVLTQLQRADRQNRCVSQWIRWRAEESDVYVDGGKVTENRNANASFSHN